MNSPERDLNPPDRPDITEEDMATARAELIDEFLGGKELGDWSLADFIDLEIDANQREFTERLASIRLDGSTAHQLEMWFWNIINRHLPEHLIEERASEL